MIFEFNPFELDVGFGTTFIKSITVSSNIDWFSVPTEAITGENVVLPINVRSDVSALKVFATGGSSGAPTMRSLTAAHIPNIEMSQVSGLQAAINSLVKTLASANALLTVTNNGVGDYTLTVNTGTTSSTVAVGNDARFPANVTGIRKSAGAGSTDTAAVAKTDYWDTTVFVASGASHAKGLVPDPGVSAGTTKFLREDSTWVVPAGSGTVTSVGLTLPGSVFSISGSPVVAAGTLTGSFINQTANTIFAGPTSGGAAVPSFRAVVYADVSPVVGTGASTIAAGNDTRFPASVTGLRKSAGAGSTDVAAVLYTDYWNDTVFGGKGPSHTIGLVPDPGPGTAPYTRYLRDDGTWQPFIPQASTIDLTMLATQSPRTVVANATGSTASPTAVDAKTARSSSLLNLESITTFGNTNYTALSTDRYVSTSATFTATRTVTLPLANTFNPGQSITVSDDFGAINGGNILNVQKQGSDTIEYKSLAMTFEDKYSAVMLSSDGVSNWKVVYRVPSIRLNVYNSSGTYTTPTGVKQLIVHCWGGGGGGGGARATSSNCAAGGGGGGGGYAVYIFNSPLSSYAMTVGVGGTGGVDTGGNGIGGGDTDFGGNTATGGAGGTGDGTGGNTPSTTLGGIGGDSGGSIRMSGSAGGAGLRFSGTAGISGAGGAAASGPGGANSVNTPQSGISPTSSFGGGGGSGALSTSATGFAGGDGGQGSIAVYEIY